jgi:hypothetical protein
MHLLEGLTNDATVEQRGNRLTGCRHQVDGEICSAGCHLCYGLQSDLIVSYESYNTRASRSVMIESRILELAATDNSDVHPLDSESRRQVHDIDKTIDPS